MGDRAADIANLFLRASFGLLVLVIHGWHKTVQYVEHVRDGTNWQLASEIRNMGLPAPMFHAVAATMVQLFAPLFIIIGFGTRPAAAVLAAILAGAVAQNLHADRDPQLAILYLLVAIAVGIWGSGRYSIDFGFGNARKRPR